MKLSDSQAKRLLSKHAYGHFGHGAWSTVQSLINLGMVKANGKDLALTQTGIDWCLENHGRYNF